MATEQDLQNFQAMEQAYGSPATPPTPAGSAVNPCQQNWVGIELLRADGTPYQGAEYILTLPGGRQRKGTLNKQGYALERDVGDPGQCRVRFPQIPGVQPR